MVVHARIIGSETQHVDALHPRKVTLATSGSIRLPQQRSGCAGGHRPDPAESSRGEAGPGVGVEDVQLARVQCQFDFRPVVTLESADTRAT